MLQYSNFTRMLWGTVLCLLLFSILIIGIRRNSFFHLNRIPLSWLYTALLIKLIAALAILFLYSQHYQKREDADIFKYYDDAASMYHHPNLSFELLSDIYTDRDSRSESLQMVLQETQHWDRSEQVLFNDNRTMILLNLALMFLSKDFYLFHLLFFCLLSFIGSVGLYKAIHTYSGLSEKLLFAIVFLPPSVLLWSSSILKESLFLFFFGLMLLGLTSIQSKKRLTSLLVMGTCLFFLSFLKSYLIICFIPSFLILMSKHFNRVIIFSVSALSILLLTYNSQDVMNEITRVQSEFIGLTNTSQASSRFEMSRIENFQDLISYAPQAILNVWLRPIVPSHFNALTIVNSLESIIYVLFLLFPFIYPDRKWKDQSIIFTASVLFVLLSSLLIGSTVPILGAIVRYRSPLIIFYLISIFTFVDLKKINFPSFRP